MKGKINILQLITGLNTGGAERVVLDISTNLSKKDFNVFVGSLIKGGDMKDVFDAAGINTFNCNINKSAKGLMLAVKRISKLVDENNITMIHAHMFHAVLVSCIVKIFKPHVSIVFTPHNTNLQSKIREYIIFALKKFRNTDIIFSDLEKVRFYHKSTKIIPMEFIYQKYQK